MLNRENLTKLMNYLRSLPADYHNFNMKYYFAEASGWPESSVAEVCQIEHTCGASACALGHGCAAGVEPVQASLSSDGLDILWNEYARQFVEFDECEWVLNNEARFMFDAAWSFGDAHTHHDAADRIEYLLKNGSPPKDWEFKKASYNA